MDEKMDEKMDGNMDGNMDENWWKIDEKLMKNG